MPSGVVAHAALALVRRVLSLGRHGGAAGGLRMVGAAAAAAAAPATGERLPDPIHLRLFNANRKNIWYYLAVALALYTIQYFGWVRARLTKEQDSANQRNRRQAVTTMGNLLAHEDRRLALLAKKAEEEAKPADGPEKPEAKKAEKIDTKPAEAEKLYKLLFDDVENAPITAIGVCADDPLYTRTRGLLAARTVVELKNVMERTKMARAVPVAKQQTMELKDDDGTFVARDYIDGMKLVKKLKFAKDQVIKFFGKDMVAPEVMKETQDYAKAVAKARKASRGRIIALMRPHCMKWLRATVMLMASETLLTSFTYAYALGLPYKLTNQLDSGTMSRAAGEVIMMFFVYALSFPIWIYSSSLVDDVEAEVQLKLRSAVMATVLSQDR